MGGTDGNNGIGWMVDFEGKERLTVQVELIEQGLTVADALRLMVEERDRYFAAEAEYEARVQAAGATDRPAERGRRCCVYRFYDADQRLLYVGKTVDPVARFKQHAKRVWWAEVDQELMQIVWYANERLALDAEDQAIRDENPVYNRVGGGRS